MNAAVLQKERDSKLRKEFLSFLNCSSVISGGIFQNQFLAGALLQENRKTHHNSIVLGNIDQNFRSISPSQGDRLISLDNNLEKDYKDAAADQNVSEALLINFSLVLLRRGKISEVSSILTQVSQRPNLTFFQFVTTSFLWIELHLNLRNPDNYFESNEVLGKIDQTLVQVHSRMSECEFPPCRSLVLLNLQYYRLRSLLRLDTIQLFSMEYSKLFQLFITELSSILSDAKRMAESIVEFLQIRDPNTKAGLINDIVKNVMFKFIEFYYRLIILKAHQLSLCSNYNESIALLMSLLPSDHLIRSFIVCLKLPIEEPVARLINDLRIPNTPFMDEIQLLISAILLKTNRFHLNLLLRQSPITSNQSMLHLQMCYQSALSLLHNEYSKEAYTLFQECFQVNQNFFPIYLRLAECCIQEFNGQSLKRSSVSLIENATVYLQKSFIIHKEQRLNGMLLVPVYMKLAYAHLILKDYHAVLSHISKILEISSPKEKCRFLALSYGLEAASQLGYNPESEQLLFQMADTLKSDSVTIPQYSQGFREYVVANNQAVVFLSHGKYHEASDLLQKIISSGKNSWRSFSSSQQAIFRPVLLIASKNLLYVSLLQGNFKDAKRILQSNFF